VGAVVSTKQRKAAKRNVRKAISAAKRNKTIAHMPKRTRTALGKQASAVRQRKRTGAESPKTRAELIEIARRRGLEGRSKMGRDELARALGER
jgi:predicted nucleic acid binding AN1-type Zn finger protein